MKASVLESKLKLNKINLPFYLAILDKDNQLVDIQYYQLTGNLDKNTDTNELLETELIKTIKLQENDKDDNFNKNTLVIGFMLDNKKIEFLN